VLTLSTYAAAKQLPAEFLRQRFRIEDTDAGIAIPYPSETGEVLAVRVRRCLAERPRWRDRGTRASQLAYGLHELEQIRAGEYLVCCEGESDLHTARYHDLPALATPGAELGHRVVAAIAVSAGIREILLCRHNDDGGRGWASRFAAALAVAGYAGSVADLRLPTKDLNDLHVEAGDTFGAAWGEAVRRARPYEGDDPMSRAVVNLVDKTLCDPELTPTDRTLVLSIARADPTVAPGDGPPVTRRTLAKRCSLARDTVSVRIAALVASGRLEAVSGGVRLGPKLLGGE